MGSKKGAQAMSLFYGRSLRTPYVHVYIACNL